MLARTLPTLTQLVANEKTRYLVAGVWNTLVGVILFALLWFAFGEVYSLWAISTAAHLASTTSSFFVQRHFVFRELKAAWWRQLIRFQLSYSSILLVVAFFINAMYSQGVHPILGQTLAIGLIFVGGFFSGKNFTFSDVRIDLLAMLDRWIQVCTQNGLACFVFASSIAAFELVWAAPFYRDLNHVGHDFSYTALTLLEGKYWLDSNGLIAGLFNPPWFTPAWCAGAAFYADPQASFYSPMQAFALFADPIFATHLSALLFAAIGFWGSYFLARNILLWEATGSVVFAVLGIANAWMPMRSAVGEPAFQPLYLWTILVAALCWPTARKDWRDSLWPAITVCLCLTAWLQFAFAGMMVPSFLGALLFSLLLVLLHRAHFGLLLGRAIAGGVLAILLNASKLYESASLMRQFPRSFYELPGFKNLGDVFLSIAYSLLQPSEWTAEFAARKLTSVTFTALPHEWAMHFGLGAFAVAIVSGLALVFVRRTNDFPIRPTRWEVKWIAIICMVLICSMPLVLLWDQGSARALFKQIPILNSATWPMRWIVVYLPIAQWLVALPTIVLLSRCSRQAGIALTGVAALVIWLGPLTEPVSYYLEPRIQAYDPKPVIRAFHQSRYQAAVPIREVAVPPRAELGLSRNDSMLTGASQGLCYNPIYGYRLEAFPQIDRLRAGDVLQSDARGQSLIFNPACLVHPSANQCVPGDGFQLSSPKQLQMAQQFLDRKPFDWGRPLLGRILSVLSQCCFWILLAMVGLRLWGTLLIAATRSRDLERR